MLLGCVDLHLHDGPSCTFWPGGILLSCSLCLQRALLERLTGMMSTPVGDSVPAGIVALEAMRLIVEVVGEVSSEEVHRMRQPCITKLTAKPYPLQSQVRSCRAACLALPCLALPCLALPCLALPCLALPCLALPCLALPCLALPCLALPCLALPCLALPCLALPCLALPCLALPCLALPCLALPCLALPCLALPCLALPCLASVPAF